jgi:Flp pilus assembly protein TadD
MRLINLFQSVCWIALLLPTTAVAQDPGLPDAAARGGQRPPFVPSDALDRTKKTDVVSVDILRNPIPEKARQMLRQALSLMESGKDAEAIRQLQETLVKFPSAAGWVHSLLGFEYMKTDQILAAIESYEQAVLLMPHDAFNHHNLGVSLALTGDFARAEEQARLAQQFAPNNSQIQEFLAALVALRESRDGARVTQASASSK